MTTHEDHPRRRATADGSPPLIVWRDEFKTGVAAVDREHEQMIRLINALHAELKRGESKEAVLDFLGEIHAGIAAHFALEESIMRKAGYDEYISHKADHDRLLDEIRDIMDAWDGAAGFDYEGTLARRLRAWFSDHFRTKDSRLHRLLR